jgi:hypothetical protein
MLRFRSFGMCRAACRGLAVGVLGKVRSGGVRLARPLFACLLDGRSTEIRHRMGNVLVDRRYVILRWTYSDITILAATAPSAAPSTAAPPSALAVIGRRASGLSVFLAEIGVRITASRPFHHCAFVLRGRHVGRWLIV